MLIYCVKLNNNNSMSHGRYQIGISILEGFFRKFSNRVNGKLSKLTETNSSIWFGGGFANLSKTGGPK